MAYEQYFHRVGEFAATTDLSGTLLAQQQSVAAGGTADGGDGFQKFAMMVLKPGADGLRPDWGCQLATGPTVRTLGVIQNRPEATEGVTIDVAGIVPVRAGAAIAAGQDVMCDATARAVPYDGTVAANIRQGVALETATAKDQVITIMLREQF